MRTPPKIAIVVVLALILLFAWAVAAPSMSQSSVAPFPEFPSYPKAEGVTRTTGTTKYDLPYLDLTFRTDDGASDVLRYYVKQASSFGWQQVQPGSSYYRGDEGLGATDALDAQSTYFCQRGAHPTIYFAEVAAESLGPGTSVAIHFDAAMLSLDVETFGSGGIPPDECDASAR
jgi:hypothetical protein